MDKAPTRTHGQLMLLHASTTLMPLDSTQNDHLRRNLESKTFRQYRNNKD